MIGYRYWNLSKLDGELKLSSPIMMSPWDFDGNDTPVDRIVNLGTGFVCDDKPVDLEFALMFPDITVDVHNVLQPIKNFGWSAFYALETLQNQMIVEEFPVITGTVSGWGKIAKYEQGFHAEYMQVTGLFYTSAWDTIDIYGRVGDNSLATPIDEIKFNDAVDILAKNYDVPTMVVM